MVADILGLVVSRLDVAAVAARSRLGRTVVVVDAGVVVASEGSSAGGG